MLKLLIIDDEDMTRNGLKEFIPWDELGIKVADEACDGQEGLDKAELIKPDIVICDVSMPVMNGIEFATKLREFNSDCKLIFISGYSENEYLRSAIRLNAVDYVEKPIQINELIKLLERTVKSSQEEKKYKSHYLQMNETIDKERARLIGSLFKRSMHAPPIKQDELIKEFSSLSVDFPWDKSYLLVAYRIEQPEAALRAVHILQSLLDKENKKFIIGDLPDAVVVVIQVDNGEVSEGHIILLQQALQEINEQTGSKVVASTGKVCFGGLLELPQVLNQAFYTLQYHFYSGWGKLIRYEYYNNRKILESPSDKKRSLLQQWEEYWKVNDYPLAREWIEDIDRVLREPYLWPINQARKLWFEAFFIMWKYSPEVLEVYEEEYDWKRMILEEDSNSIKHFIQFILTDIETSRNKLKSFSENYAVRSAANFILSHLSDQLSIQIIAKHVHLTPTYLCMLFKKDTGKSIHHYITEVRMEMAKKLLLNRQMKLYEVAEQVGYNDAKYFSKVFRKMVGINPTDYRDGC